MRRGEGVLAAGYFGYFGAVGIFQPYFPAYLAAIGFPAAGIGLLLGLASAMRVVAPLGVGWIQERVADQRRVVLGLACLAAASTWGLARAASLGSMAVALAAFGLGFNGLVPAYDAHVLDRLGAEKARYGRLRLWGSIGFIACATAAGALFARTGAGPVPLALALALAGTVLVLARLRPAAPRTDDVPAGEAPPPPGVRRSALARFLAACFLHLAGFGAYYGFFTLYLQAHGYSEAVIGLYWAAGVVAEIAMFAFGPRILPRVPLETLLRLALLGTVLRWSLVAGWPDAPAVLLVAQLLHLAGFGLFHSVTVLLGPRLLPRSRGASAQALVSSVGWGAGGVAGSLLAGALWTRFGPRAAFAGAAVLAALAVLVAPGPLKTGRS